MNDNTQNANTNKNRRTAFIVLFIFAVISLLIWFYSRPKAIAVEVAPVTQDRVEQTVANTRAGTVKACRRAKLSPSVGGQITELPVKEGDAVKAGQLLLSLWNNDLKAQLSLAKNEIQSAKNQANSICLQADFSRREARRLKSLQKSNAISEEKVDNATTLSRMHSNSCQSAKSAIKMKIDQQNIAKAVLERTRLIAPFDGVIADISAELSEYVTPSPVGVQTLPVIDLIDNNCFYVAAPIDEVDAPAVVVGMPARISLDAFGDNYFQGSVRRIAAFVLDLEKQARTVDVEVEFSQPDDHKKLLAGYSADVEVILLEKTSTLRIPTEALIVKDSGNNDETWVWVYDPESSSISSRIIETGLSNWTYTEVLNGLKIGEQVVLSIDKEGLADGVSVKLVNSDGQQDD